MPTRCCWTSSGHVSVSASKSPLGLSATWPSASSSGCAPAWTKRWTRCERRPVLCAMTRRRGCAPLWASRRGSDQAPPHRAYRRLDPVLHLELDQNAGHVVLDRVLAEEQRLSDLDVVHSARDQLEDLELPWGERRAGVDLHRRG